MRRHPRVALLTLCAALLLPAAARADDAEKARPPGPTPLQIVRENTEEVLAILRENLGGDDDAKADRRRRFMAKAAEYFDWPSIARHAMGVHWRQIDDTQREEFTQLLRRIIEQTFRRRLEMHAVNARVEYVGQEVGDTRAVVYTAAVKKDRRTPIDYYLARTQPQAGTESDAPRADWIVYDVKVEGVSLLLNIREQIHEIWIAGGYDLLMQRMRKKIEK